jgi:phosphatidate cytidylyltransferase
MDVAWRQVVPIIIFGLLSLILGLAAVWRTTTERCWRCWPGYIGYLWAFLLMLTVADYISFRAAIIIMVVISYTALREYFSLLDWRPGDRWAMLFSYLSIPFMFYLILIDWYGFFIVSIPVYVFLVVPFLVALGDRRGEGSVLSIGAIDFGIFFCVFCLGHIAYLTYFSTWLAMLLVLSVAGCCVVLRATDRFGWWPGFLLTIVFTQALSLVLRDWTGIPLNHSLILGLLIPILVQMGNFTIGVLERDLGIGARDLEPGRGRVLDALKAYLFTAPIVFHYLRWALKFGEQVIGRSG